MRCDVRRVTRVGQAEDCAAIDCLNRNLRYNNPGDFANYPIYD